MSNWCMGCFKEIRDGDYCNSCQASYGVNSLGYKPGHTKTIMQELEDEMVKEELKGQPVDHSDSIHPDDMPF
jgi:hypothetical protein